MTLRRAVLLVVALVVVLALVPPGVIVLQQVEGALDQRLRDDLEQAPRILDDRWASVADVRMMHARDLAQAPGLPGALMAGDTAMASSILVRGVTGLPERPILVDASGAGVVGGPRTTPDLLERTRRGEMPVEVVTADDGLHLVALAPVDMGGRWIGAAGGSTPFDDEEAQTLAGLTRTEVVLLAPDGMISGRSLEVGDALAAQLFALMRADTVSRLSAAGATWYTTSGELPGGAKVFFLRDEADAFGLVSPLRATILTAGAITLLVALLAGFGLSAAVARPVGALADAADTFRADQVDTPLPSSGLSEVERLTAAFGEMRERLAARLDDLESVNEELADGQRRLASMQAELVQRERRLATGQLVSQLAHEIRNPIASIRNCLEVILRDVEGDEATEGLTRVAIQELSRMHELSEQMLSMNRPAASGEARAEVRSVAMSVERLVAIGEDSGIEIEGPDLVVALPPDGLQQVLLNLILNGREASEAGPMRIEITARDNDRVQVVVEDEGPGIDEEILARIFDPFFTTKDEVQGVGLGLFVAEAIVRRHGGAIHAENRDDRPGARFVLDLPAA